MYTTRRRTYDPKVIAHERDGKVLMERDTGAYKVVRSEPDGATGGSPALFRHVLLGQRKLKGVMKTGPYGKLRRGDAFVLLRKGGRWGEFSQVSVLALEIPERLVCAGFYRKLALGRRPVLSYLDPVKKRLLREYAHDKDVLVKCTPEQMMAYKLAGAM